MTTEKNWITFGEAKKNSTNFSNYMHMHEWIAINLLCGILPKEKKNLVEKHLCETNTLFLGRTANSILIVSRQMPIKYLFFSFWPKIRFLCREQLSEMPFAIQMCLGLSNFDIYICISSSFMDFWKITQMRNDIFIFGRMTFSPPHSTRRSNHIRFVRKRNWDENH